MILQQKVSFKEYEDLYNAGQIPEGFKSPGDIAKEVAQDITQSAVIGAASGVGRAFTDPFLQDKGAKFSEKFFEGAKSGLGFGELPSETISKNFNISDKQFDVIKNRKLFYDPELANLDAAKASGRVDDFNRLNRVVKGKQVVDTGTTAKMLMSLIEKYGNLIILNTHIKMKLQVVS